MEFSKLSVTVYQINSTELNGMNSNAQLRRYTWNAPASGLDTPLAMHNVADSTTCYYRVGANKNIVALTSGKNVVAQYEYIPFGTTITQTGDMAAVNPFRFSSEYHDDEIGLVYYNYRYYNPTLGRWLSRDPIGEDGGENLYGFVNNNPIIYWDLLGTESRKKWHSQEEREKSICIALKNSNGDLQKFLELYDPTFGGKDYTFLRNLEIDTKYGNTDIDWMLTLLAAHYGRSSWIFKNENPRLIYFFGKHYWILKDAWDNADVDVDFNRYGQQNELIDSAINIRAIFA